MVKVPEKHPNGGQMTGQASGTQPAFALGEEMIRDVVAADRVEIGDGSG
jgi:hypothetical protein